MYSGTNPGIVKARRRRRRALRCGCCCRNRTRPRRASEVEHRAHVSRDAGPCAPHVLVGRSSPQLLRRRDTQPCRDVAVQRVVRRGLVGHGRREKAATHELGQHIGAIADETDRQRCPTSLGFVAPRQRVVHARCRSVDVARITRRWTRAGSTSTARQIPSFIVAASGCAPPMPPKPPVRTIRPRSDPPNLALATAPKVS